MISFHGQIVPSQIVPQNSQIVPQNSQFVPQKIHFVPQSYVISIFPVFFKCVNVIRVQNSDRNVDESIFRTIYIMVRVSYVKFTQWRELMFVGLICLSIFDHNTENKIKYYVACSFVSAM